MSAREPVLVSGASVSRSFERGDQTVQALSRATFSVAANDRIAVVGPSGSGKSTLLHLMAGLIEPTAGQLTWPTINMPDVVRSGRIAIVFQASSLVPWLDVIENVEAPLLLQGIAPADARKRATASLAAFGLADLAEKLPEELSGGQAQRVAIARAAATDAKLLVADEPTGQLDTATAKDVMATLLTAAEKMGAALVVATHDPTVAGRLNARWTVEHGHLNTTP